MNTVQIDTITIGPREPLAFICGPCVLENKRETFKIAERIRDLSDELDVPMIFKSSYTKANRQSAASYTGPGIRRGLTLLSQVKEKFDLPIITDVHCTEDVRMVADVADIIQVPAFLCRQTALVKAVARTRRVVNIKKGQFLAPEDMGVIIKNIEDAGNTRILVTERGASFGYHNLVVDMRALPIMARFGYPVVFDATHSVQLPGAGPGCSGGEREFIFPLARAAVAAGCQALFIETHPLPSKARCDAASMLPLPHLKELIEQTRRIHAATA